MGYPHIHCPYDYGYDSLSLMILIEEKKNALILMWKSVPRNYHQQTMDHSRGGKR